MTLKIKLLIVFILSFSCFACISLDAISKGGGGENVVQRISNEEAVAAIKDALKEGTAAASRNLSKQNGYFGDALLKILLPPEAANMIANIDKIPGGKAKLDEVVLSINRSAEDSARDVVPIFERAITSMTLADGIKIVKGKDTEATDYFKEKTKSDLIALYKPNIDRSLNKPLVLRTSANTLWGQLVKMNNDVVATPVLGAVSGLTRIDNVDLGRYCTDKALDGLFLMVASEEKNIRREPLKYVSDLIKKVFGAAKDGTL